MASALILVFLKIPPESLIGAHIHERHGLPKFKYIPKDTWRFIADENQFKARKDRQFHILLDIHLHKDVYKTYRFCRDFLEL